MYIPAYNKIDDTATLLAFMRSNSFVSVTSVLNGQLFATHIPVLIEERASGMVLVGHVAKANPHWKAFDNVTAPETLVIFAGFHAYVSPSVYENRQSVPTWNYMTVHAYGRPRITDNKLALLDQTMQTYEAAEVAHWAQQTDKYRDGMLAGIVAFEIEVTRLEGKFKLSQNRSPVDQSRITAVGGIPQNSPI